MKELSHDLQESCSAAILQGAEIVYVARMPAPHRIMSTTIAVGSRLSAFYTSLGRIQLGFLAPGDLEGRLDEMPPQPPTTDAIPTRAKLKARILADREQGYSIVDEELEKGLRSVAVPIVTRGGVNVGAVNLSAHASRATRKDLRERFLPRLQSVAQQVSRTLVGP